MKKFILWLFFVVLLAGCGKKATDVTQQKDDELKPIKVVKEADESVAGCFMDGVKFSIVFKDGQIVKYYDPYDGELDQDGIDLINNEHLVDVTDDNRAIAIMNNVIKELGGYCEKEG